MTKRIFRSICAVAIAVFVASLVLIMGVLYDYFSYLQLDRLKIQTELAATGVAHEGVAYFSDLTASGYRITLISSTGEVLYDTSSSPEDMENHLEREEVAEALKDGYGESSRYSSTLTSRFLYSAKRLPDGSVIRLSEEQQSVISLTLTMGQPIAVVAIIAVALSILLARSLTKSILKPLIELDLDSPQKSTLYDELLPLLNKIDSQNKQLRHNQRKLQHKQDEFDAATGNMSEGLVLLNDKGIILSINRSASRLLEIDKSCVGIDISLLNRTSGMLEVIEGARDGVRKETTVNISDRFYRLSASPVISRDKISGIALLIFDVTEKEEAERMRYEFTANVSHELKTPLHSISGYAELLKNGIVKPEDVGQFSGRIYGEAQRMIRLVDDIIKLSRLDEGASDMVREQTDMFALAADTVKSLTPTAEKANISLTLSGEKAEVFGIPQLLSGIIFNLCDNAIKYGREGGYVKVKVEKGENGAKLIVEDNGIGIPEQHKNRIFERFYRVDKSHSKEVGGTGLGLSIVKHAAKVHGAEIALYSAEGKGTTVTVTFKNADNKAF